MKTCVSVDMDNYQDYRSLVDPDGADDGPSFYLSAIPRYLDLFDRFRIRATFFMVGRDAALPQHRDLIREMVARGHEIGNHTFSHPYDLRRLDPEQQREEIQRADEAITEATGQRPWGFRAPSADMGREALELLVKHGYRYDASTFPSPLMWVFMVYGKLFIRRNQYQLGEPAAVTAPTRPYVPRASRFYRAARPGADDALDLVEIPLSVVPVLRIPFYATFLRMFDPRFFDACVRLHGQRRELLHVAFHLIDLVDLEGTNLHRTLKRTPGINIPFARRERFARHVFETMGRIGESATLGEIALETARKRAPDPTVGYADTRAAQ
ncbi:MAG: polysaccharide deacetylase family protein [Myxococcota bacterium]